MKTALKGAAYAAPFLVTAGIAREVNAVSPAPPPTTGSITFTPTGAGYVGVGSGMPLGLPFQLLISDATGEVLATETLTTDGAGRFTVTIPQRGFSLGNMTAPAKV